MSPNRIGVVFPWPLQWRTMAVYQRILYLSRRYQVVLFTRPGVPVTPELQGSLQIVRSPLSTGSRYIDVLLYYLWLPLGLLASHRRARLSCLYTFRDMSSLFGLPAKRLLRWRWVADIYDDPGLELERHAAIAGADWKTRSLRLVRFCLRRTLRQADLLITIGTCPEDGLPTILREEYSVPDSIMLLVPNGVDLAEVPEKPEPGSDSFTVFYVGGIATQNGASVLLQAFRRLSQTRSNARLVLAGEIVSSEQAHYERELQPGNGVAYLGPTPPEEVHRQMESAHVCVYPFLHTRATDCVYPVKVFEYLAMGRPVIASRLQGVSRIIRHEWNGLLVEPGDAGALAGALERIAADAELRASLARRARASVERFDWAAIHAAVGPRLDTALLGAAS